MEKKGNIITQIVNEYKKVHWASKKKVFQSTIIVLIITLIVAVYISVFDLLFTSALDGISKFIIRLFS